MDSFKVTEEIGYRWNVAGSFILQKFLFAIEKPLKWWGILFEFTMNLVADNGGWIGFNKNLFTGGVKIPDRKSSSYRSFWAHVDDRVDLYKDKLYASLPGPEYLNYSSKDLFHLCVLASKVASENEAYVRKTITDNWKMHFIEFFDCWNAFILTRTTQAFICSDKAENARLIVVAFRGTDPFEAYDWATDADNSWFSMGNMGRVHVGFMKALGLQDQNNYILGWPKEEKEGGKPQVAYYSMREKLKRLIEENKDAKFIVTGHSLGGALAILFISLLFLHDEELLLSKLLGILTFGQPRVGDEVFGKFMDSRLNNKYFRMVYRYDLVPRVPFDSQFSKFKHFGQCIYYSSWYRGKMVEEEPNENYYNGMYVADMYFNAWLDLFRALLVDRTQGPDFKESWLSLYLRLIGLLYPGLASHSFKDYVNSVKLAK